MEGSWNFGSKDFQGLNWCRDGEYIRKMGNAMKVKITLPGNWISELKMKEWFLLGSMKAAVVVNDWQNNRWRGYDWDCGIRGERRSGRACWMHCWQYLLWWLTFYTAKKEVVFPSSDFEAVSISQVVWSFKMGRKRLTSQIVTSCRHQYYMTWDKFKS